MAGIRARRKAERPNEILEAAFEEFVLKGYAATRIEDIASRVGITKGTIYFYFDNKERLFEDAIRTVGSAALARLVAIEPIWTGDIVADLTCFLKNVYAFVGTEVRARETLRLLIAEAHRLPQAVETHFAGFVDPIFDRLKARVEEAVATGALRQDIPVLSELIISTPFAQHIMLMLFADRRVPSTDRILESHLALLFKGILPTTEIKQPIAWSIWRPVPDARSAEMLTAPIGAGLFELRQRSGELLLGGDAVSVVARLALLLLDEGRSPRRKTPSRRPFLPGQIAELDYRTAGCKTIAEARALAEHLDHARYRYGRMLSDPGERAFP